MRFQTEINSYSMSVITRIIPEDDDETKCLIEAEQDLRNYVRYEIARGILLPIRSGFDGNIYYIVFNLKKPGDECSAMYFIKAMKSSQKFYHWSTARFPNKFPKGWEVIVE